MKKDDKKLVSIEDVLGGDRQLDGIEEGEFDIINDLSEEDVARIMEEMNDENEMSNPVLMFLYDISDMLKSQLQLNYLNTKYGMLTNDTVATMEDDDKLVYAEMKSRVCESIHDDEDEDDDEGDED